MKLGIVVCTVVALALVPGREVFGKQLSVATDDVRSRIARGERGFIKLQDIDSRIAALGVGKPPTLSLFGSWVTSDYEPDFLSTNGYWCDFEDTVLIALFYTGSSQAVLTTVRVYSTTGALVYSDDASGTPTVGAVAVFGSPVGHLYPGAYKVVVKSKQGGKVVGSQFWIAVYASSDQACQPGLASSAGR